MMAVGTRILVAVSAVCLAASAASAGMAQGGAVCSLPPSRKVEEYGGLSAEEERARLDRFMAEVEAAAKGTKGFIIAYAGRGDTAAAALARADAAKVYLVEKKQYGGRNTLLNTLVCGRRESPATELWLTPAGAAPPVCSATLGPREAQAGAAAVKPTPPGAPAQKRRLRRVRPGAR